MTATDQSDREIYLAELRSRDEDVEGLLSGGADIDDLIAAGVLDAHEPDSQDDDEGEEEIEPTDCTEEEAIAWLEQHFSTVD